MVRLITRRGVLASAGTASVLSLFPAEVSARSGKIPISHNKRPIWREHPQVSREEALAIAIKLARRPSPEELAHLLQHDECIDDRSLPKVGFLNYPGAHICLYALAAAFEHDLKNGLESACEAVEFVAGGREKIRFHANGPTDRLRGCKHCELLFGKPEEYDGLNKRRAKFIAQHIEALPVEPDVLPGEHSAHIGFIVTRDGTVAPDGSDAWAFDTVTDYRGKDLHAFVFKPSLVTELRLRPLARELHTHWNKRPPDEAVLIHQLSQLLWSHFLQTARAIAPNETVQWFHAKIGHEGVISVKNFRI